MSSPEKKTTKRPSLMHSETPQSTLISSLPDDLLLSCFARISILYYPTLSLVSKSFRSLLASPELYQIRSSLDLSESCLYVCLKTSNPENDPNPRWFTLCQKPDRIVMNDIIEQRKKKEKKRPNGYVLAEIPIGHSRPVDWNGLVAVGSNIYNIGAAIDEKHSSSVSIFDCTSNTWREAPSMRVNRRYPAVNAFDGKIYVAGGCKDCVSSNLMEVFDPKTQTWESVSSPNAEICGPTIHKCVVVEEEICLFGDKSLAYKPKEGTWRVIEWDMDIGRDHNLCCVIDDVLYSYDYGGFCWYDSNSSRWRKVKGVRGLRRFAKYSGEMVDYDGDMAIFWDTIVTSNGVKNKVICCAIIELERRYNVSIWGKVLWHDAVLSVPMSYEVSVVLAPIL